MSQPDPNRTVADAAGTETGAAGAVADLPAEVLPERYLLQGEIARGGMGLIVRVHDRVLDRTLALKAMQGRFRGEGDLQRRFLDEARIASQLQHPGVAPVHDLGTLRDGRPFFTMKLVQGRTLAELLTGGAERSRLIEAFEQVAQTVAYAHSNGVIHRDLKPSNVMVGAFSEVQVMDWGLAKELDRADEAVCEAGGGADEQVTRTGSVMGTFAYMPPEQARGQSDRIGARSDVFALGAMLCEILTGRPPYLGRGTELRAQAERGDVGPALQSLRASGADGDLIGLARACLSPEPAQRPADASAVAAALAAHRDGVRQHLREAELGAAAAAARAQEARKRQRAQLILGSALLGLLVVAAGVGAYAQHQSAQRRQERSERDLLRRSGTEAALAKAADLRRQSRYRDAGLLLDGAGEGLPAGDDLLGKVEQARRELRIVTDLYRVRSQASAIVGRQFNRQGANRDYAALFAREGLGTDEELPADVADRLAGLAIRDELVEAMIDWASTAPLKRREWLLAVVERLAPQPWLARLRAVLQRNDEPSRRALAEAAVHLPPRLLATMTSLLPPEEVVGLLTEARWRHPSDFWITFQLGTYLGVAGANDEAVGHLRAAVALQPSSAVAHQNLGLCLSRTGRLDEAVRCARESVRLEPEYTHGHASLGSIYFQAGRMKEAEASCREAIRLDPKMPNVHFNLGLILMGQGEPAKAADSFREVVRLDPADAQAHLELGRALAHQKKRDEAVAQFRRAVAEDATLGEAHRLVGMALAEDGDVGAAVERFRFALCLDHSDADSLSQLGMRLAEVGRMDEAIDCFREAVRLRPDSLAFQADLGRALMMANQTDEAAALLRAVLARDPNLAPPHATLGSFLADQGRYTEGIAHLRRALELLHRKDPRRASVSEKLERTQAYQSLRARVPAVLRGEEPDEEREYLVMASLCQRHTKQFAAAARLYARGFAASPGLARNLDDAARSTAAAAAVQAAFGKGTDADGLDYEERTRLRRQALVWLEADLRGWTRLADRRDLQPRLREILALWLHDASLADVRGAALRLLPTDERSAWWNFWVRAAALAQRVGGVTR